MNIAPNGVSRRTTRWSRRNTPNSARNSPRRSGWGAARAATRPGRPRKNNRPPPPRRRVLRKGRLGRPFCCENAESRRLPSGGVILGENHKAEALMSRTAANPVFANPIFDWADPLLVEDMLSEEERLVRDSARAYCQEK